MFETSLPQPSTSDPIPLPVLLSPRMSVPVAVQRIIEDQSSVFQSMLPVAFLAENTEGVHKVRVSLRRMRALLKIVRPYYQKKFLVATRIDLKFIRDVHGRVRDMDVFHQNFALNFFESHPGEDYQSAIWQPVFNQTYQDYLSQIRSAVTQDITQQLIQTLNKFQNSNELLEDQKLIDSLPQNIAAFLPAALNNQLEKILEFQLHPDGDRQYSSHHRRAHPSPQGVAREV